MKRYLYLWIERVSRSSSWSIISETIGLKLPGSILKWIWSYFWTNASTGALRFFKIFKHLGIRRHKRYTVTKTIRISWWICKMRIRCSQAKSWKVLKEIRASSWLRNIHLLRERNLRMKMISNSRIQLTECRHRTTSTTQASKIPMKIHSSGGSQRKWNKYSWNLHNRQFNGNLKIPKLATQHKNLRLGRGWAL